MMKRGEPDLNRQSVVSGLLLCVALLVAPCAGKEVRAPLSLSAEQVARAGDEFCVWLNLARLTRGLAPEEKPSGASIVIFDRKGRSIACRVIEDLNPLRPHGSGCYVVWRKPKGAPGPFRGSLIIGGKAEPERDATLRGVNRLRNGGFEEPPGKGRILPQHWGSFRFKPGTLIASQEAPRSGRRSLKLANASAKGKGVYFSQGLGVPPTLSDRSAMMYLRFYQKVVKGAVGSGPSAASGAGTRRALQATSAAPCSDPRTPRAGPRSAPWVVWRPASCAWTCTWAPITTRRFK